MNAFQDDGAPAPARTETGASPNVTGRERTTDTGKSTSLERTFDSPLAGALACGELDAPAFPLVASREKVPAFKGWQAAATTDTGKLRGWAKRFPRCNFGVATEAAGLVVLDEDTPGDLAAWAESEGIDLPETFAVATGRDGGGTHFWFHTAEVFKSSSPMKRAGFNVDVKARGAFVVAPGSVHKSGAVYRVVNDAPIADLPDALAAHLRRPSETAYEVEPPAEPLPDLVGRRYIDVALDGLRADLAEAAAAPLEAAPRWDPTVMHAAYRVVELSNLAPGVFTRADALRFLSEHAPTDSDFTSTNVELKFIHAATELGYTGGREKVAEKAEEVFGDLGPLDGATPELAAFDPLTDVFEATDTLGAIRQAAYARVLSAPALLGYVLVRVLAEVPHTVRLPPVIGSAASLNLGVAVVGDSGGGKSSTLDTSRDLLGFIGDLQGGVVGIERSLGSGEGLAATFLRPTGSGKNRRLELIPEDERRRIMVVDEIEALGASKHRQGATIGAAMRSALTGGPLGQENASLDTRRNVPGGVYRLVMVAGVQPTKSGVLLDEADLGTPQRFIWLPARDPMIPDEDMPWPGELGWVPGDYSRVEWIDYADDIKAKVRADRRAAQRGTAADRGLTGHLNLTRLKVAAALALLHDEAFIGDQWWTLAGRIVDASLRQQDYCRAVLSSANEDSARARGRLDQVRADGAAEARDERATKAAAAIFREVRRHAEDVAHVDKRKHSHDAGCTDSCLRYGARNYRKHGAEVIEAALVAVETEGWLEQRDGRWFLGPSQPADA